MAVERPEIFSTAWHRCQPANSNDFPSAPEPTRVVLPLQNPASLPPVSAALVPMAMCASVAAVMTSISTSCTAAPLGIWNVVTVLLPELLVKGTFMIFDVICRSMTMRWPWDALAVYPVRRARAGVVVGIGWPNSSRSWNHQKVIPEPGWAATCATLMGNGAWTAGASGRPTSTRASRPVRIRFIITIPPSACGLVVIPVCPNADERVIDGVEHGFLHAVDRANSKTYFVTVVKFLLE